MKRPASSQQRKQFPPWRTLPGQPLPWRMAGVTAAVMTLWAGVVAAPDALAKSQGKAMVCDVQVPAGGTALADALAAAESGARLCLAPGVHLAGLTLARSVTLQGAVGAQPTVLQGPGRGSVLRIDDDGLLVRLEGLTLTGGVADAGGGLAVRGRGKVQVENCVFRGNKAGMLGGGGLYARAGMLHIERTTFADNEARQGGGLFLDQVARAELVRCTFETNRAEVASALRLTEASVAEVRNSRFSGHGPDVAQVSASRSRVPKLVLTFCEVDAGLLVNGPELPGVIQLKHNKLPASWRGLPGVADLGGNTWRTP